MNVAFERKNKQKERPDQRYWNFLKAYFIIIPALFFMIFLPRITQNPELQFESGLELAPLFYQSMHMGIALILHQTHVFERTRNGAGDKVLKLVGFQQLITRNLFGFLFILFVWYKLPAEIDHQYFTEEEREMPSFTPKTLYILTGIILIVTLLVIISQML